MYDNMGRGRSRAPTDGDYSGEAHVRQLDRLLRYLGVMPSDTSSSSASSMSATGGGSDGSGSGSGSHDSAATASTSIAHELAAPGATDNCGASLCEIPLHVMGHSMGGALAALVADAHRARVASLVLVAPAGLMDAGYLRLMRVLCCVHPCVRHSMFNDDEAASDFHKTDERRRALEAVMVARGAEVWQLDPHAQFDAFWESLKAFPLYGLDDCVRRLGSNYREPHANTNGTSAAVAVVDYNRANASTATASAHNDADAEQRRVDERGTSLPILLVWGQRDETIPFAPNLERWVDTLQAGDGGQMVQTIEIPECGHNPLVRLNVALQSFPHDPLPIFCGCILPHGQRAYFVSLFSLSSITRISDGGRRPRAAARSRFFRRAVRGAPPRRRCAARVDRRRGGRCGARCRCERRRDCAARESGAPRAARRHRCHGRL
jgi:pimeloyl-ACP methyl ester carboxylesterase